MREHDVTEEFDYIVVGGGSAGMPLAARLSQRGYRTLLIEAGRRSLGPLRSWITAMPSAYGYAYRNPKTTWLYYGEPEPALNNRRLYQPRGKVLGGSSAVNGLGFLRPHPALFDRWVNAGAIGWSYADVLPYFKRLETWHGSPSFYRGTSGPIHIRTGIQECSYYETFFQAGRELRLPFSSDINGADNEGFADFQLNVEAGHRSSTAHGYLRHVANARFLTILDRAQATRILFNGDRAIGVEYARRGSVACAHAAREVIVSCGAFDSPKLLMLSGIGPEKELQNHGIPLLVRLEGVGQNLQDHPIIYPKYESTLADSPIKYNRWYRKAFVGAQWQLMKSGPGTSNQMEAMALLRSGTEAPYPNIEFQFCPLVLDHDAGSASGIDGWSNSGGPVEVEGRGWVKLSSSDPMAPPRILCNFMSTDKDVSLLIQTHALNRALMETPAFQKITKRVISSGALARSRSEILEYLRAEVGGDYHPVGTCAMGAVGDSGSVVDAELRVLGVRGLRVVDASIMPVIPNANTNATSIMIGERAADLITVDPS
jgi:choline dehydrogenase